MCIQNIISLFYILENKHVMIYMQQKHENAKFSSSEQKFFWKQPLPGFFALSPNKFLSITQHLPFLKLHKVLKRILTSKERRVWKRRSQKTGKASLARGNMTLQVTVIGWVSHMSVIFFSPWRAGMKGRPLPCR